MPTHEYNVVANFPSGQLTHTKITVTGDLHQEIDVSVPAATTDMEVTMSLDVSACKSFYILSTQDITVETNDGTTPGQTLSLNANEPYFFHENSLDAFKLTTDVTALFLTNAGASAATVKIRALSDATP